MKSYDEIANSIFERRDKYIENQRKKRIIVSIVTSVTCCGIVLIAGFGLWISGIYGNNIPVIDNSQNVSDNSSSDDTSSNSTPNTPPVTGTSYFIDSIDKIT